MPKVTVNPPHSTPEQYRVSAELVSNQKPAAYLGEQGVLRFFNNSRGYQLASYFWPATTPTVRGVVQLLHGHGGYLTFEYCKFQGPGIPAVYTGSWIEKLNAAGWSVCGLDNQGCGRSQGLSCYIDRLEDYVDDTLALTQWSSSWGIPGFAEGTPRFMLGESLGGCVAVMAAMRKPELFAGVVLLAPMLSLEKLAQKGANPYLRPFASWLSYLVPTMPIAATNRNNVFPELQRAYDLDPWTYKGKTRARNAVEYLQATERLSGCLDSVTSPFIVFHSEKDTQVDPDGSKRLYEQARSEDKTLRLLSDMWHLLVKETGNELILTEVLQWLDARAPQLSVAPTETTETDINIEVIC